MKYLNWESDKFWVLSILGFDSYQKGISSHQTKEERQAHRAASFSAKIQSLALPLPSILLKCQNSFVLS